MRLLRLARPGEPGSFDPEQDDASNDAVDPDHARHARGQVHFKILVVEQGAGQQDQGDPDQNIEHRPKASERAL